MKISRETGSVPSDSGRKRDRSRRISASGVPGAGDMVTISVEARRRVEPTERGPAAMEPEERARLVAALKNEVESGRYRPDLRRTAMFLVHDADDNLT